MVKKHLFLLVLLTFINVNVLAQGEKNQFDADGKRHGLWKKNFQNTTQPRYEGQFNHGKEVGLFKFYKLIRKRSVLSATKYFQQDGTAKVKFLSSKGKIISEGQMKGKLYIGAWKYYHKNSNTIMTLETYNTSGELIGERKVFYKDGLVAEIVNYKNGQLEGTSKYYANNGTLVKSYVYVNGQLNGPSKHYDSEGRITVEGPYKNGKKHSVWKYYSNGKLIKTKDFTIYSKNPYKQY
ncbi:MAG: toxin-antitoxin system YwqK family antitoxin [Flavobacteriaceae bacterium]|nr:toxin-antitoxin system YwqK family antitoxin [Flavobacteriaceae bacterium]